MCGNEFPLPLGARLAFLRDRPDASNLEMSVAHEIECRKKHNAHVPCHGIVLFSRPFPRSVRRYLISPQDHVSKFLIQILGR